METIYQLSKKDLISTLHQVLDEREIEQRKKNNLKSLSVLQVSKKLGRAHATIRKYIDLGIIKATPDGRVLETELERYLNSK